MSSEVLTPLFLHMVRQAQGKLTLCLALIGKITMDLEGEWEAVITKTR